MFILTLSNFFDIELKKIKLDWNFTIGEETSLNSLKVIVQSRLNELESPFGLFFKQKIG